MTAAPAHHTEPWLESLAYRVDSDEGSIAFAGDSAPCDSLRALADGVDSLVVHCWNHQHTFAESGEGLGEMGTLDAAKLAQEYGIKRLIVNHYTPALAKPGSKERAIGDIARIYGGEIVFTHELMVLPLS